MTRYTVSVSRTMVQFVDVSVEADTEDEAKDLAIEEAKVNPLDWEDVGEGDDYEVHEIDVDIQTVFDDHILDVITDEDVKANS